MQPELYHAHHNLHHEDLPFWLELARQSGGPMLELGCGTGRVLLPLAETGQKVIGIDYSLPMLQFTRGLFHGAGLTPWLVAADMRSFHLEMQFALILLPCNTFSTLDRTGRLACLERVQKHLEPGGLFGFCIPNPARLRDLPARSEPELEDEFVLPSNGNPVQVSSAWQRTLKTFTVTWIYDQLLPDGMVVRSTESVSHQMVPAEAYLDEVCASGFEVVHRYGDFDRTDYGEDSPFLICISKTNR